MFRKLVGIFLIIAAVLGLIISIGGIVGMWMVKDTATAGLLNSVKLLQTTLDATYSGLVVADQALTQATTDIARLGTTVQTAGKTVGDMTPLIDSISQLLVTTLPDTITAVQTALDTAQSSAGSIESTLRLLSAIPLLPIQPYQPEVPLTDALAGLGASLEPVRQSLVGTEDALVKSKENLTQASTEVTNISESVGQISTTVTQTKAVLAQYQTVLTRLQTQLATLEQNLVQGVNTLVWLLTAFLIWLGLAQIGLLTQGLEMVGVDVEGEREVLVVTPPEEDAAP